MAAREKSLFKLSGIELNHGTSFLLPPSRSSSSSSSVCTLESNLSPLQEWAGFASGPDLSLRARQAQTQFQGSITSPRLEWHDITFSARIGRGKNAYDKVILNNVSGFAMKGELTAIIGPSGSGKTTLMNVLTGRISGKSQVNGKILFQGNKRQKSTWKSTVGYVEQFDHMYDSLTCWETLAFSAVTRLPQSYTVVQKLDRARSVLQTLNLEKVSDIKVGSQTKRGVSGGERKRVAIGCELVTSPKLLCLDECTSGLDSHSALSVISIVQQISRLNVAVLCTIHQPSFEIFSKFDKVILMALGRIAFHGTISDAIIHFAKLDYPLPQGANAADHFLALVTEPDDRAGLREEERHRVQRILDVWSEIQGEMHRNQDKAMEVGYENGEAGTDEEESRDFGLRYTQELYWLVKRAWTQQIRAPENFIAGFGQSTVMSLLLGFTFFRLGDSQGDVIGRSGLLFFFPISVTFSVLFPIVSFLPLINGIVKKDRCTGAHRVSTYYLSRYSVEIPVTIASRLIFLVTIYWMCNFNPSVRHFFIFLGINCLSIILSITVALFVGSLSSNLQVVLIIAPAMNIIFYLYAGFLLPLQSIPKWFIWIHWISYATYTWAALMINEFKGLRFSCPPGTESQCYANGQQFLDRFDLAKLTISQNVGAICVITLAFAILGYLKLRHLTRPNLRLD